MIKILEDAGWHQLQGSPLAYRKADLYIVHTRAIHPGSTIADYHPWILEKSHAYYLIQVDAKPRSKVLNSSRDLKELITIAKLMELRDGH